MGVKIFDLVPTTEIDLKSLKDKTIVIDGNLSLYQFLSSIRQRDGTLLMDSSGNVTSHLTGLFSRTTRLMQYGIKPCFVFDGKAPDLKQKERDKRRKLKEAAEIKYEAAKKREDVGEMKKFASRTSRLTPEMITEAKELLGALGIPCIQSPSEGEAQATQIVKNSDAYAVGSQDADSFLFGAPRVIKNLTISARKKIPNKLSYSKVKPELIELSSILNELAIDQDHLIALGMLVGTDYNVGGIKGIGPKNALKLVKQHKGDFDNLFKEVKWDESFDYPWTDVFYLIKKMSTTNDYKLDWKTTNTEKVIELLCEKHEFSQERIMSSLEKLGKKQSTKEQPSLNKWF